MPTRLTAPIGSPCWADLWTSDVEGSRAFYSALFGWEAEEPSPEFGGYFMFTREGAPVAGAMGDMGDMPATNTWRIYLATDDISATLQTAVAEGAQVVAPAIPIADLGIQASLVDPTGAHLGVWQPGSFPGFTLLSEPGAPSWFELQTRGYDSALAFYRSTFRWETKVMGDSEQFRYTVMLDPGDEHELAGIIDATGFLPDAEPGHWTIYWQVEDDAAAVAEVKSLGGHVVMDVEATPYGRVATVADPAGAIFRVHTPNG